MASPPRNGVPHSSRSSIYENPPPDLRRHVDQALIERRRRSVVARPTAKPRASIKDRHMVLTTRQPTLGAGTRLHLRGPASRFAFIRGSPAAPIQPVQEILGYSSPPLCPGLI